MRRSQGVMAALALTGGAVGYGLAHRQSRAAALPRAPEFDGTLALLRDGYTFISDRCRLLDTDAFRTRLLLRQVVCMQGEDAVRTFYAPGRFTRRRAMPGTTVALLQDWHSVQTLDDEPHRTRKQLFMAMTMTPERVRRLESIFEEVWADELRTLGAGESLVLHDIASGALCRAVCDWAGAPLAPREVLLRTREFSAMIDGAGRIGWRHLRARMLRRRTERWARALVLGVRTGGIRSAPGAALHTIAWHREHGQLLPVDVAAVELLNVLRPTVAVARFITFAALALHQHSDCRRQLSSGDETYLHWFTQEVRRLAPFFPTIGGRARAAFVWQGHRFAPGTWVLLDLFGTNRDPRLWADPEGFRPERFRDHAPGPHELVPQGGGTHATGHRCPGEDITMTLVKVALRRLVRTSYVVPPQDLTVDLRRMPALPASGFVISSAVA